MIFTYINKGYIWIVIAACVGEMFHPGGLWLRHAFLPCEHTCERLRNIGLWSFYFDDPGSLSRTNKQQKRQTWREKPKVARSLCKFKPQTTGPFHLIYNPPLPPSPVDEGLEIFLFLRKMLFLPPNPKKIGSFYVSVKLPTYPSPKPTSCSKWELTVNVVLGEGKVGGSSTGVYINGMADTHRGQNLSY